MKTKAKTFHIIVWSMLTLAGFNLLAAKEPLYDGLGSDYHFVSLPAAGVTRCVQKPRPVEPTLSQADGETYSFA